MNQMDLDEDEDTHICLRCRTTIIGLDAYVSHRKTPGACPPKPHCGGKSSEIAPLAPDRPKSPDADDFFMSLELQSLSNVRKSTLSTVSTPLSLSLAPNVAESSGDESEEYRRVISPRTLIGGAKWRPGDHPPPNYTGGKWVPTATATPALSTTTHQQYSEEEEGISGNELDSCAYRQGPPPGHTSGKWVPATGDYTGAASSAVRISGGTVQYWCGFCNRRLSSRAMYDKHLLSDLHARRTRHERELDENSCNQNTRNTLRRSTRRKSILNKTAITEFTRESNSKTSKRFRRYRLRCGVCRARIWSHFIGKHLVSHYHWRAARSLSKSDTHHSLILDYIHEIVRHAPFQCTPCHFYCNLPAEFRLHWNSESHRKQHNKGEGNYFCSFCRFSTSSLEEMSKHLLSNDHRDLIRAVNGSVPITIERRLPITCFTCKQTFRYNAELRRHSKLVGHKILLQSSASDCYQDNRKPKLKQNQIKPKICNLCRVSLPTMEAYKLHLNQVHADLPAHRCIKCGSTFSLSQQLTHHARSGVCSSNSETVAQISCSPDLNELVNSDMDKCDLCQFEARSYAEMLYHNTVVHPADSSNKVDDKWDCPVCSKKFRSKLLEAHIRTHTGEKPFSCNFCPRAFGYRSSLVNHLKIAHDQEKNVSENSTNTKKSNKSSSDSSSAVLKKHRLSHESPKERKKTGTLKFQNRGAAARVLPEAKLRGSMSKTFPCTWPKCGLVCRSHAELRSHERTHTHERPYACVQCDYRGRTKQQLMRHMGVHGDARPHQCLVCNFASRFRSHLVRHMRIHTGSKPYRCPYCSYECNMLENLRKHVLVTGKHPGKRMYECSFCSGDTIFSTDLARDFQSHLQKQHETRFSTHVEAMTYVAAYHMPERRSSVSSSVSPEKEVSRTVNDSAVMSMVLDPTEDVKIFIDMPESDMEDSESELPAKER